MLEIGSMIDRKYKILNKIGQGGMSNVYLAMNERANKPWAIKEVRKDGVKNFEIVKQGLIVETELLKRLHHPNLPSIVDVIDEEGRFLIVMDYIEGIPLSEALQNSKSGYMEQQLVIEWAKQICHVFIYLHSRVPPIIYRDMKPANIMLKPDGNIMVIDFGTAREFKEHQVADTSVLGTAGYAAPEQYGGHGQTDVRTDIYCLGATLYHLLTGKNPCTYQYGIFPFQEYPIRYWNTNLSSGLEEIILKCTARHPKERYQSSIELLYALEHYEALDEDYKKKQKRKLSIFYSNLSICFVCTILSLGFLWTASYRKANQYDTYITEAISTSISPTDVEKIAKLKTAIELDPVRADAYFYLLNGYSLEEDFSGVILSDGMITSEEDEILRNILNGIGTKTSQTNISRFQKSTEEYERFSYELGIAYYYYFENPSAAKNFAREWLQIASNAATLSDTEKDRATKLSKIAGYYTQIGVESKSGDTSISYLEYWNDLLEISQGNLVEATNNKMTALAVYGELATQIYTNTAKFKSAGVIKEEMEEQLDNIEKRLEEDIIIDDSNNQQIAFALKEKVAEVVLQARVQIEITYGVGDAIQ
ncbi:MAG: serine/threonine-protein kinase [Eubacteriales bacterium]